LADHGRWCSLERCESECLTQQRGHETLCEQLRIGIRLPSFGELGPVRLRNSPIAAHLVTKIQPFRDAIVALALQARLELCDLRQPFRRQETALDRKRLE